MLPERAWPVPFCGWGFLPPPLTSLRVFVLWVPCTRRTGPREPVTLQFAAHQLHKLWRVCLTGLCIMCKSRLTNPGQLPSIVKEASPADVLPSAISQPAGVYLF